MHLKFKNLVVLFTALLVGIVGITPDIGAISKSGLLSIRNGRPFYDPNAENLCASTGGAASKELSTNIPEVWRSLIARTAPTYPDVDARLVASVLWAENRGWPEYKTSGWAESNRGAAGPWQFIPQTWASMGTDGDGDGRKDPENPADAVHAAFKHHAGSAGKPIAITGFNGNAEESFDTTVFERNDSNLLYYSAKYNGGGAPNGTLLKNFPDNENSNYVIINYWLLATNFATVRFAGETEFIDATTAGALFEGQSGGPITTDGVPSGSCGGVTGSTVEGFPLQTNKSTVRTGVDGTVWCFENRNNCHHDYNAADIFVHTGTKVVAAKGGTVVMARDISDRPSDTGSKVVILGDDNKVYYYAHMGNGTIKVEEGQKVTTGTELGDVGTNENAAGTIRHLHFDILPPPHTNRVSCSGADCSRYPFINVQPGLVEAFGKLPEN